MRRFALFAAVQWFGVVAFCQSAPTAPGNLQASPGTAPAAQSLFHFDGSQLQIFPQTNSQKTGSCAGQNKDENQASIQVGANQFFHAPCLSPNTLMTANYYPVSPALVGRRPQGTFEPIPTQWPKAKFEQIPTTWPNLKVQQISGPTPDSASQK